MANPVTTEEIILMNRLYLELGTYAAVGRKVGRAGSTVKKYIDPTFIDPDKIEKRIFQPEDIPDELNGDIFINTPITEWHNFCLLDDEEVTEIHNLWKEILI